MRTKIVGLNHSSIRESQRQTTILQLRDHKLPVYFRYFTNREKGSFYLVINKNNQTHWLKLGVFPYLTAANAKEKAIKLLGEASNKQQVVAQLEFVKVAELLNWYHDRIAANQMLTQHSKQNQAIIINKHLLPLLGSVNVTDISLPLIDKLLYQPLQTKIALSSLENILAVLGAAFKRASKVELIPFNPLAQCTLAEFTSQRPKIKSTKFTHQLLKKQLKTLPDQPVSQQMLFVLLLVHATRIGETVSAKWEHFDFEEKLWRIPATHTKNKKAHILPLVEPVNTWLKHYKKHQNSRRRSPYLFAQLSNSRKPISANQGSAMVSRLANGKWSAHDLRKFARSSWMELGVDYMVGEFLLNHTLNKLDQTYIQTIAMPNCRSALDNWCQWLQANGLAPSIK
ncbi:hypothetical protein C2869_19545 [Saccharobesus litoralis]|uniref:Tyr recombinase domain-containing protein n=1 Tax=Saccharobesus litoralis TaxID=2172099 RepID=A0A2S0VWB8_9ALTE|nr:site-specific integrase [Saccharobesus litoralis]AWB68462.1 hypothetical protein C2869_19545 [Saccharobesus litoralis]